MTVYIKQDALDEAINMGFRGETWNVYAKHFSISEKSSAQEMTPEACLLTLPRGGSMLVLVPHCSCRSCSPWLGVQLWVVAMLKQLFPMYWVESAGGLL